MTRDTELGHREHIRPRKTTIFSFEDTHHDVDRSRGGADITGDVLETVPPHTETLVPVSTHVEPIVPVSTRVEPIVAVPANIEAYKQDLIPDLGKSKRRKAAVNNACMEGSLLKPDGSTEAHSTQIL